MTQSLYPVIPNPFPGASAGSGSGPGAVLAPTPGAAPLIPNPNTNTQTGTLVTINTPSGPAQFEIPNYFALPVAVREAFFRTDTGVPGVFAISTTGIDPQVVDQFRNLVTTGLIRPVNQAAAGFVVSQGGWQAGDQTPLGPLINGLPGGLTTEQWQVVMTQIQQQIQTAEALGYFTGPDGQPLPTLERTAKEAEIASRVARDAMDRARMEAELSGMFNGSPTELARQFNERLAFDQQQALAQASADPRRIVEAANLARVYGASRGGAPQGGTPLAYTATGTLAGAAGTGAPADPAIALSPENVAYLSGRSSVYPTQFGNPSGVAGQQTTLGAIGQQTQAGAYNFRQTPAAYNALSPTGRAELGAVNLSLTGQSPEDWEADIKKQLPSSSGQAPAAYRFG